MGLCTCGGCSRRKDGKRHALLGFVESYRTERRTAQRVVAWLGANGLSGAGWESKALRRRNAVVSGAACFGDTSAEWVEVDVKRVHVERSRKFGGPWLGAGVAAPAGSGSLSGRDAAPRARRDSLAADGDGLVLGQLCDPSSGVALGRAVLRIQRAAGPVECACRGRSTRTAFCPGAGCAAARHKPALEKHSEGREARESCSNWTHTCCCCLVTVTSTYFEGQAEKNHKRYRGYSRQPTIGRTASRSTSPWW